MIERITGSPPAFMAWEEKANEVIDAVNRITTAQWRITADGPTGYTEGKEGGIFTIALSDVDLGVITGSRGSNAALASLLTAMADKKMIRNNTS